MRAIRDRVVRMPARRLAAAGLRLSHPASAFVLARDLLDPLPQRPRDSRHHLNATMQWLCRAQDHGGGSGVAAGYSLVDGWLPPYPETTGYIIPTFYDYAHVTGREEFYARARRMADWEIEVQLPSGAVQAGVYRGETSERMPAVFNTGQVILGLCRAFTETRDERYLAAATRAGNWLVAVQSTDGSWPLRSPETETDLHAYDVRTAWSLLELQAVVKDKRYGEAARRNVEWTLAQQHENGWFENNAFFVSGNKWSLPLTHTIAYVLEGMLEVWRLVPDKRYFEAVQKTAERLMRIFELRRFMPGEFDSAWKSTAKYSCLTGNAQIAGVWLGLFELTRDTRYLNAALKLNDYVKGTQSLYSVHLAIRGGVKGSQPITGHYTPFTYVSWGAKFLADSLMREERLMREFQREVLDQDVPGEASTPKRL